MDFNVKFRIVEQFLEHIRPLGWYMNFLNQTERANLQLPVGKVSNNRH